MSDTYAPYAIGDLATLGGVSRRTVRYYVQEGLIPPPAGLGRGNHYGTAHLEGLLRVKAMQEDGHTLDDIRRALQSRRRLPLTDAAARPPAAPQMTARPAPRPALGRSLWRRLSLARGVELHIDSTVDLPSPAALRELDDWCRRHLECPPHDLVEKDRD